jgi:hypothetical protein
MTVYVAEINGRGIAAVNSQSLEAEEFFHGEPFKSDLKRADEINRSKLVRSARQKSKARRPYADGLMN